MEYEELVEIIRQEIIENLRLDVDSEDYYVGGCGGESLYKTSNTVQLMLGDKCISKITLD